MLQQTLNTPRETTHQRIADALEDIVDKIADTSSASNVNYDNTQSGLSANKVQGAVDELASEKADKSTTLAGYGITDAYTKAEVYTQSEVNNIVSTLETNIDWKEAVNTYSDIATTYPNPQDGWTVNVKDTDYTYRYNGSEWVAISANAIPEATTSVKGLMTSAQVSKLNGIEAGAQVNTVTSVAGKTGAVTLTKSDVGLGNVDNTSDLNKPISTAAQTALNSKVDKATGKGLSTNDYTNEEKQKNADNASAIEDLQEDISQSLTATGNPLTIESSESNLVECVAEVEAVQEGSGTPSPTNIRPIIGQTEVVIEDAGKNLFDKSTILEGYRIGAGGNPVAESGTWMSDYIYVKDLIGKSIVANVDSTIAFYSKDKSFIERTVLYTVGKIIPQNAYYLRAQNTDAELNTYQIELGTTASEYEPYQGKTYTIQLGDTIYGGELDVIAGELRVTHGYAEFDGSSDEVWSLSGGGYRVTNSLIKNIVKRPSSGSATDIYLISNRFIQRSATDLYAGNVDGIGIEYDTGLFCAHYGGYRVAMTVADWKTWLSNNPLQVVYELAEPFTIQLTPQQIRLLKGTNNISCNTGDLSIKYYPDNVLGQLKGDIESEYDARLERLEQYTDVFGFIEDMDVLSPTERIKYIGKNENYEPLTVDLNTGSYTLGDWGDFPFLVDNKPYMVKPDGTPDYQLNEYDYTKKLDGTASDVANENYDGGAFSWGRKIYKKQWMEGNKRHVLYSFNKKDGFHADGFIDKDGKELDGRWIPMFYGTVVNGKAKSIASGNCITGGNLTTDAQHNAIVAFDSNANFFGGAFVETLIDLLMMFAKNSDLQAAYGYGNSSGYVNDSSKNYGMLNNAVVNGGQFYGRSGGKTLNKALHSIVLATYNSYMRDPYEVIKNGKVVVSEDYTYDPTGATYTDTGITVPDQSSDAWRYPKKYIAVPRYGSIPDISVGGASTSLGRADGTYTLANQSGVVIVCRRFGDCGDGAFAGLSCRGWNGTASDTWWNDGFALLLDGSAVA